MVEAGAAGALGALADLPGVVVRLEEPVSRHGNLRIGGPVDAYLVVQRLESLAPVIAGLRQLGLQVRDVTGLSDIVAWEEGLGGVLVRLGRDFCRIERSGDGLWVGAAAPLAQAAVQAVKAGLPGWGPLVRYPGTLGGWISEAGAAAFVPCASRVQVLSGGKIRDWEGGRLAGLSARALVLGAELVAPASRSIPPPVPPGAITRLDGDVPDLLFRSGLAGVRLRSIRLAAQCPGVVVNLGQATSSDLAIIIRLAKDRLQRDHGYELNSRLAPAGRPTRGRNE